MQNKFTRFFTAGLLAGSLMFTGCADDGSDDTTKSAIDDAAIAQGVMVTLNGDQGSVIVPLTEPLPADAATDDITQSLSGAVSLIVESESGTTASLIQDGTLVNTPPANPGEYMWTLRDDRLAVEFTFFNQTMGGLSLDAGKGYTAAIQVIENDYVEDANISVPVFVGGA